MNKLTKISAVLLATLTVAGTASAVTTGGYVGGSLGTSTLRTNNPASLDFKNYSPITTSSTLKSSTSSTGGLSGKVFAGYNFNNNFGIETAFAKYASSEYKATNLDDKHVKHTFDLNAVSVVGKAYLPLVNDKFNVYGLAGLALVNSDQNIKETNIRKSRTVHRIRPTFGIGASYDITTKLTANVELSRIQGTGNTKTSLSAIPNADMLSAGLAYNFG